MVMLFTVFQYIPLTEEENSTHVELSKKNTENNETENDTDTDEDNADDIFSHNFSYTFDNSFALKFFSNQKSQSLIEFKEISTPPPKTA